MITFITFADNKYNSAIKRLEKEAILSNFFDNIILYTEKDLPEDLKTFCISNTRGYGYWIWKPYFLYKTICNMKEDDILVYCDAGCTINIKGRKRFEEYIQIVNNNEFANISFQTEHLEKKVY